MLIIKPNNKMQIENLLNAVTDLQSQNSELQNKVQSLENYLETVYVRLIMRLFNLDQINVSDIDTIRVGAARGLVIVDKDLDILVKDTDGKWINATRFEQVIEIINEHLTQK